MRPVPNIPRVGDRVLMHSGYFQGVHGLVVAVHPDRRVADIAADVFGARGGTVEVPFADVTPAQPPSPDYWDELAAEKRLAKQAARKSKG
jgi:hypothetical protein